MEHGTWLRLRRIEEKKATRDPDPRKREKASARIRELDEKKNR